MTTYKPMVVFPWTAAGAVWGPYGVSDLRRRLRAGEFGADDLVDAPGLGLDPLLRWLVPIRLWFGLGIVVIAAKVVTGPNPLKAFESAAAHGVITMITGPYGVLLGVLVLAIAARFRRSALRLLLRPTLVAVITIVVAGVVFGLQISVVRQAVPRALQDFDLGVLLIEAPWPVRMFAGMAGGIISLWLLIFGVCGVYLMHRNGFSAHSHPWLRPMVGTWLALCVAAVELTIDEHEGMSQQTFLVSVLAGPAAVALLSVVEMVRLRRLGIGLRSQQPGT